ncbi:PREDICTED: protein trichome birefringence-like 2 [Tarenaya hassleriana]|uniref:protein trichome birefringence-like 2 n=1 Tax=Tarenaya hassleriana TaxID=28532 RepID=UPI00053C241D|nr:PREDICTED: protein trichome birefringence-like 2 [Tarenaya hassleriana]
MDSSKKLVFSDQILSSRRKILTRFGLGIAVSLAFLTLLLLTNSSNVPLVSSSPLFQAFRGSNLNPSTASWRFSFPGSSSVKQVDNSTQGSDFSDDKASSFSVEQRSEATGGVPIPVPVPVPIPVPVPAQIANLSEDVGKRTSDQKTLESNAIPSANSSTLVSDFGGKVSLGNGSETVAKNYEEGNFTSEVKENQSDGTRDSYEDCDIYDGNWVRVDDETMPYYPPGSCPYIDRDFNCFANGRTDDAFVKWRWQPNGCDIPRLNATDFLEKLRGKKLVFVGDSINRNMWESLVCILRHSLKNKKAVYEISGRGEFKKKGFYAFRFEDYNCTVDFVGSPFLVRESSFKGENGTFETLRLDLMDKTTSMYQDADILVFNTGHWWTHDKTKLGENYYQEGNYVHPRLKVLKAYKRALMTWARWVDQNIDRNRTHVIFRGYSVTHFRGGPWNSGGQCHRETEPIFNKRYLAKYPSKMRALEYILRDEMKTPVIYMNISRLTDFRKDGHPSIYRKVYETEGERREAVSHQDCSHWCLPGVPDTWNELLYVSLLKKARIVSSA